MLFGELDCGKEEAEGGRRCSIVWVMTREQSRGEQRRAEKSRGEQRRAEESRGEQRRAEETKGLNVLGALDVLHIELSESLIDRLITTGSRRKAR
jgi:hypothetical protein